MDSALIVIAMRWLHVASAAVLVGGLAFIAFCAPPAGKWPTDSDAQARVKQIEARFRVLLSIAVFGLLLSGLHQWVWLAPAYREVGPWAQGLIGVKVMVATVLLGLLWAVRLGMMARPGAAWWRWTCLALGALVMVLGAWLRFLRWTAAWEAGG